MGSEFFEVIRFNEAKHREAAEHGLTRPNSVVTVGEVQAHATLALYYQQRGTEAKVRLGDSEPDED